MRLRAMALVALLAPAAMVAVLVAALAGDLAIVLLAVLLILAGSGALWLGLTMRGAGRIAGLAVATLAGAGLVVVLATHWRGILVLLALLLLLTAFGWSARYALQRGGQAAAARLSRTRVHVGAANAAALIINLKSGGGKAERLRLADEARARGVAPIVLRPGQNLLELTEGAIARGAEVVGMAGGDGSQALVATVAARCDVAHVCVPAGTRNHFALDLGLDRDDVIGALDAFTDGVERQIDLARVNERVFVNNASLGVYAKVVQSEAYRDEKLDTWARMLPDLLGPGAPPIDLEFTAPDGSSCRDAPLVLVSNNPYQLTRLAGAGTRPRIDTGVLGVVAAKVHTAAEVSQLVGMELVGQAERFPGLMSWSAPSFEVRSGAPVEVGLDGEALVMQSPLRFVSMPGALRVRLPPTAGLAPAASAVSLTVASLGALVRVAAGR